MDQWGGGYHIYICMISYIHNMYTYTPVPSDLRPHLPIQQDETKRNKRQINLGANILFPGPLKNVAC